MIIVQTNKWLFLVRLLLMPLGIGLIYIAFKIKFYDKSMPFAIFLLIVFIGCLGFLASLISFFGIIKVSIDTTASKMELRGFFSSKEVLINSITEYYTTEAIGRGRIYNGLLIKQEDGSVFELTELNLVSVTEIENLLIESNIKCFGKIRSYYPLTRKF